MEYQTLDEIEELDLFVLARIDLKNRLPSEQSQFQNDMQGICNLSK